MSLKQNIYGSLFVSNNITGNTLNLSTINENNSLTQLLVRDNSDGIINYRDVSSIISAATSADTFVTGFTYDDSNNLTISRNDGIDFTTSINIMSALTVTSLYGVNTIQDDGGELTIISDDFKIKGDGITIQDNGGNDKISIDTTISTPELSGEISFIDNQTFSSNVFVNNILTATTISATTYFGDGSNLTGISTDNFFVSGGTYNSSSKEINFTGNSAQTTFDVDLTSLVSSVSGDTFVVSGNANAGTSELTFSYNTGGTFTVTNSAALFSDNDINVTGGTYNPSNGCVSFVTNSGTTFDVCGFVTGITDTYTTGSTLVGETIQFNNNIDGLNYYNVSLSPVLSGKTNNITFNTYTSDTQTILDGKVGDGVNVGGATEIFRDKTGTTLNFRTLSGGSNTTVTSIGDINRVDVTIPAGMNTYVTGFTYDDNNKFTINDNAGSAFTATINQLSGLTVNGTLSATTLDGGTILSGGTNLTTIIESFDTYVTGGTVSISATTNTNSATIGLLYKNSEGVPHTLPFDDTFTTGATYDNGTALVTFDKNDGTNYFLNLSTIDVNDTFVSGGTYNDSTDIITFTNTSGGTFNVTGITDTFVTGGTYSSGTTSLDFSGNNGFAPFSVNVSELIDDTNTFVTGFTYNDTNTFTISNNNGDNYSASIDIMSGLTVNGESVFSGTGTDVVQIYGSGSTTPIFRVEGSAGELFSITDSLIGELFSVNNISGLPILTVNSDNTILWGNNTSPSLNTTIKKSINSGLSEVYSIPVSAYTGGFFEYTVTGAGARAGSIMSIFSGTSIDYNETTTNDIGDTSGITFDMNISGGTANLTVSATTNSWEIKTIVRSI
jgi:hypothetical protein